MEKMKKWLALLLAVLMAVSLLAACGDAGYVTEEDDEDENDEKTSATKDEGEETEGTLEQNPGCDENLGQDSTTAPSYSIPTTAPSHDIPTTAPSYDVPTTAPSYDIPTTAPVETPSTGDLTTAYGAIPTSSLDIFDALLIDMVDSYGDRISIGMKNVNNSDVTFYYRDDENYEYVLYVEGDNAYGYFKYAEDNQFYVDQDSQSVADYQSYLVGCFLELSDTGNAEEDFTYAYCGTTNANTGEAYLSQLFYDDSFLGYVAIDPATGLAVYEEDYTGEVLFNVYSITMTDSWDPELR